MSSKKDAVIGKVNGIAQYMGKQIYFRAMRDAFAMVVPFLVLTGFVILFNNVIIDPAGFMSNWIDPATLTTAQNFGAKITNGTMNILSILIVILISYSLSVSRKAKNPIIPVVVAVACMITLMPTSLDIIPTGAEDAVKVSLWQSLPDYLRQKCS